MGFHGLFLSASVLTPHHLSQLPWFLQAHVALYFHVAPCRPKAQPVPVSDSPDSSQRVLSVELYWKLEVGTIGDSYVGRSISFFLSPDLVPFPGVSPLTAHPSPQTKNSNNSNIYQYLTMYIANPLQLLTRLMENQSILSLVSYGIFFSHI